MRLPLTRWDQEKTPAYPGWALRAWRWELWAERANLTLQQTIRTKEGSHPICHYFSVSLHRRWRVAFYRDYYDGDHRALWLGWLCISWGY